MRKIVSVFFLFFITGTFIFAQEFGGIKGTVKDGEEIPLPGVSVTLTGSKIAPMATITSRGGHFRFLNLPVGDDYILKVELLGFKTLIRQKLIVSFARDVILTLILEETVLEEEVTVVGRTPVIDTKRTQVGVNVTEEMIMSLPTVRNPWVIMSLVPGMLIGKEDVGGNEAGQQYGYSGHGSRFSDNTWSIDGAYITDNAALGAAPAYFNLASYEELQINYGNNDVKAQTGGVQLNFVSKRGGNKLTGTFYLDIEREQWQSSNATEELLELYETYNPGIQRVYLYGANFGGPIIRDRAWFYTSYGIQDIHARNIDGSLDETWLVSGYGKLNFQLTSNTRAEFFVEYDNKLKWNRIPFFAEAAEMDVTQSTWNQDGPGYIWKGELEQMFGNLYLNAKAIYRDLSFFLHPQEQAAGKSLTLSYYPQFYASGSADDYGTSQPGLNINTTGNYFAEDILGGDHEIKFGVDYMVSSVTSYDFYEGNLYMYYFGPDDFFNSGEFWMVDIKRDLVLNEWLRRYSLFVQDTMTFGRLAISLGLRYDNETSMVKDQIIPACPFLTDLLPALEIDKIDPGKSWSVFSPRLSFIFDIAGDGKNVFKISLARYGSQEGFGMGHFLNPATWGGIGVYWDDLNGDGLVANNELFGEDGDGNLVSPTVDTVLWSWGINIDEPASTTNGNKIDPGFNSPLLDELTVSFEREMFADFGARFEFFYKKAHKGIWDRPMLSDGFVALIENMGTSSSDQQFYPTAYDKGSPISSIRFRIAQPIAASRF